MSSGQNAIGLEEVVFAGLLTPSEHSETVLDTLEPPVRFTLALEPMVERVVGYDLVLVKNFEHIVEDLIAETERHFDISQDDQKTELKLAVLVAELG